jgi:putative membrane protein insertion efficiency factor
MGVRKGIAPRGSLAALPLIGLVKLYRLLLSPYLGGHCRFVPSCSLYAWEALERFGALRGTALAVARLLRCHPFCEGGCDPVPQDGALTRPAPDPATPRSTTR